MFNCFICKAVFSDPKTYLIHLKAEHKVQGNNCVVQCTIRGCVSVFTKFSAFKKHFLSCFLKMPNNEEISEEIENPEKYIYSVEEVN